VKAIGILDGASTELWARERYAPHQAVNEAGGTAGKDFKILYHTADTDYRELPELAARRWLRSRQASYSSDLPMARVHDDWWSHEVRTEHSGSPTPDWYPGAQNSQGSEAC